MAMGDLLSAYPHERLPPYSPRHRRSDALGSVFDGVVVSQRELLDITDTVTGVAGDLAHGERLCQPP